MQENHKNLLLFLFINKVAFLDEEAPLKFVFEVVTLQDGCLKRHCNKIQRFELLGSSLEIMVENESLTIINFDKSKCYQVTCAFYFNIFYSNFRNDICWHSMQKLKTRVIKKDINPVWNEDLTLSVADPNIPIKLVRSTFWLPWAYSVKTICIHNYSTVNEYIVEWSKWHNVLIFLIIRSCPFLCMISDSVRSRHIQHGWQNGRCRVRY